MKIVENLCLVGSGDSGVGLTHPLDCNVYFLRCAKETILVDSGVGIAPILIEKQIEEGGFSIDESTVLLLTHCHADHAGGASYFREKYGLRVAIAQEEADFLENAVEDQIGLDRARDAGYYPAEYRLQGCPVDIRLADGENISLGLLKIKVIHTPGHSPGSVCFSCDIERRRALFVGDLLSFNGAISLQNIPGASVQEYGRSVLKLEGMRIEMLLPGHYLFTIRNGQSHIDKAISAFRGLGLPPNNV